jgi:hypothetical protein
MQIKQILFNPNPCEGIPSVYAPFNRSIKHSLDYIYNLRRKIVVVTLFIEDYFSYKNKRCLS